MRRSRDTSALAVTTWSASPYTARLIAAASRPHLHGAVGVEAQRDPLTAADVGRRADQPTVAEPFGQAHPQARYGDRPKVVVIGSSNSAFDICGALWEHDADVTMVQRSSTHIVESDSLMGRRPHRRRDR